MSFRVMVHYFMYHVDDVTFSGDALLIRNVVPNDTLSSSSDPYIRTSSDNKDIQNDSRTRHAECAPLNATKYMLISYLKDAPP